MKSDLVNLNYIKTAVSKFALKVFLVAVAVHLILQYAKITGEPIKTALAEMEIRRDVVEIYGYIFKNEEIIYPPGGSSVNYNYINSVNYLIEDGGKAGRSQLVAQVRQTGADFWAKDQIDELTAKLDILNKSNINLDFVTVNIDRIDGDSRAMYINMLKNIESGNFKSAGKNKNELLILLNRRQLVTGANGGAGFDALIASAAERKRQLEARTADSNAIGVYSEKSGIFYSNTDGYENYLTADAAKTLDFDTFGELMRREPDADIIKGAVGKIAYDFNWYLVCKTEKSNAVDYIVGKTYDIIYTFSRDRIIESVLTRRIDSTDSNEIILVFEASVMPPDFDFSRRQAIQIITSETSGIKVPEEAMRIVELEEGVFAEGVYVRRGGIVLFRELPKAECLGRFDGYYLYLAPSERPKEGGGTLQLYEYIITAGKDIYDGKIVD